MIRKQVYIESRQEARLKGRAAQLGVTEAALIRQGLDHWLDAAQSRQPDPDAWEAIERFIKHRMRTKGPQRRRRWTRDQLHDR